MHIIKKNEIHLIDGLLGLHFALMQNEQMVVEVLVTVEYLLVDFVVFG